VSLQEVEKFTGIPFNTIRKLLKTVATGGYRSPHQVFTSEIEVKLTEYLMKCSQMNRGLTPKEMRELVYCYGNMNHMNIPTSLEENQCASLNWLHKFLKRNPSLPMQRPEATNLGW